MVSVPGPTRPSCVRVRRSAPDEPGGSSSGLEHLVSRRSVPGMPHPWARAGSHRFPGDPSYAFALLQDPGRADKTSPLAVLPTPPPANPNRRPQRVHNLEANTGLQHPLSTLHERRCRLPCKTRFRLAGCASTGRGSNPLDRFERFQVTSPFSFPGLLLSQGSSTPSRPSPGRKRCSPISRAIPIASPSPTAASSSLDECRRHASATRITAATGKRDKHDDPCAPTSSSAASCSMSCPTGFTAGLCQAAFWRTRRGARLPVPLHASDRYCQ